MLASKLIFADETYQKSKVLNAAIKLSNDFLMVLIC
jgi:hypothetical protein